MSISEVTVQDLGARFCDHGELTRDDSEMAVKYRRHVIAKARGVGRITLNGGNMQCNEIQEALLDCLQTIPEWDFHRFNSVLYGGRFIEELKKRRKSYTFMLQVLVKLHDTEIAILKKGFNWRDYWAKMKEIKEATKAEKRIKKIQFIRQYGWQFVIALGLVLAVLNALLEFDFHRGYFMLLRFGVTTAFGFWAWEAHRQDLIVWRNVFGVMALLYNPFLPVHLGSEMIWGGVNLATVAFVGMSAFVLRAKPESEDNEKPRVGSPREQTELADGDRRLTSVQPSEWDLRVKEEAGKLRDLLQYPFAKKNLESLNVALLEQANKSVVLHLTEDPEPSKLSADAKEWLSRKSLETITSIKNQVIRELRMIYRNQTFKIHTDDGRSMTIAPNSDELFDEMVRKFK